MRVVTADVPTLCPMLRMKFMSPAAALVFSAGRPTYPASVRGTNRKAIGAYCHTRNNVAAWKLISRSTCLHDMYIPADNVIQPKAMIWRAWKRVVSLPTIGSKTSTTRAAAESTIPALCAVYPIRVCRSCGMSTVELNKAIPRIRNIRFVVTTLKFLNKRTSTMGSF